MAIKTEEYLLPENLLCFFHYGDEEGLDERDMEIVNQFVDDMVKEHGQFHILSSDEQTRDFVRSHDLSGYGWMTDSCVVMTFAVG